jgi:Asp-tRNA(Asn)/Glu-tRNA(Gln) amidotransferase A subunit family amidase
VAGTLDPAILGRRKQSQLTWTFNGVCAKISRGRRNEPSSGCPHGREIMTEDLTWMPAWHLRELIDKREVSCVEVTDHFLGRIEELNPKVRAFSEVDVAGARAQAEKADRSVRDGADLGPLHGIPTSVKSHIRVKGFQHTHGTVTRASPFDDISVERLRSAGAIIVGTNTMMGAGGGGIMDPDRPGVFQPFNWDAEALSPWDTGRVPGWSSSGGAAAAVARLLPVTIGSDGGGSTRLPAAYSGVVGLHTTRGLIPHIDYEKPTMLLTASYGPLARDVRDVAMFTRAIAGPDGRDYVCLQDDTPDCAAALDTGVEGTRLAWTDDFGFASRYAGPQSRQIIELVRKAAAGLGTLGARLETTDEVWQDRAPETTASWNAEPAAYEVMVGINLTPLPPPDYDAYRAQAEARARNWMRFRDFFRRYDVILSATAQRTAPTVSEWDAAWSTDGPSFPGGSFAPAYCSHTMIFNWLGFPAVSVPCGFFDGLPIGLQIASWPGREDKVLRVAYAFQQAFPRDERPPVS